MCVVADGHVSLCGVRKNTGGILHLESYGIITALALEPIEKKPFRRFFPGRRILSIGSYGCNLRCPFCQNYEISMKDADGQFISPESLALLSLEYAANGNIGVAYTYNEPLVGFDYVLDCARLIHKQGQKNALVTNGFINEAPFTELLPYIDAANIDLKAFTGEGYRRLGGELEAVKRSIKLAAAHCHVEVTSLIVPGLNDSVEEVDQLAQWLAAVSPEIPLHVTRFYPRYKMMDTLATPLDDIQACAHAARRHLRYVYIGNC